MRSPARSVDAPGRLDLSIGRGSLATVNDCAIGRHHDARIHERFDRLNSSDASVGSRRLYAGVTHRIETRVGGRTGLSLLLAGGDFPIERDANVLGPCARNRKRRHDAAA